MRAVVQRVTKSEVLVDGQVVGRIGHGFNILLGVSRSDTEADLKYMEEKIKGLRVFEDDAGKMNRSIQETEGAVLLISQFTLYGDARKGRRPSFIDAAPGDAAERTYLELARRLEEAGIPVEKGVFGAHMEVLIENDGPVTILLDSTKTF